jgi:hypothetical protein
MATLYLEGYDLLTLATAPRRGWSTVSVYTETGGRGSGGAIAFGSNGGTTTSTLSVGTGGTSIVFGMGWLGGTTNTTTLNILNTSSAVIARLQISTAGAITVQRGSGVATLGTTATTPLSAGTWKYLEVRFLSSATVGEAVINVDGVEVLNLSSQNTQGAAGNIGALQFSQPVSTFAYIDDMYVLDTGAFWGDTRVVSVIPSANGTNTSWTATGTAWKDVSDISPDAGSYISSSTATEISTFTVKSPINIASTATLTNTALAAGANTAYLFDADLTTNYVQAAVSTIGRYFQFDFGASKDLYAYRVVQDTSANYRAAYNVDGSADGTTWVTLSSQISTVGTSPVTDIKGSYRYYRVITTSAPGIAWRVYEIELYGGSALSAAGKSIKAIAHTYDVPATTGAAVLQPMARISGTNYTSGGTVSVTGGAAAAYRSISTTSPATSTDWTIAEVNAAEFGPRFES